MPEFVRVHLPGVGTWTQAATVPLRGATVLDEPALTEDGRPIPDVPATPTAPARVVPLVGVVTAPAPSVASEIPAATADALIAQGEPTTIPTTAEEH